jgi:hypothetical protein
MSLVGLNYDNLSNILDYLFYIDIYQLNCALLYSKNYLPLLSLFKNYLKTMHIEDISMGFVRANCIFYHLEAYVKEENIREYTQILLWIYTCKIQVDNIEILEDNGQLDENKINLIDILFKIPTNRIDIGCNNTLIIDKFNRALIESKQCRDTIQELILEGCYDISINHDIIVHPKTDLIDWPILINLKKIRFQYFYFLSNDGAKNILNGAPNLESLTLDDNSTNVLDNLQLMIFDKVVNLTLLYEKSAHLTELKKYFPNINYLDIQLCDEYDENNENIIELPESLEKFILVIDIDKRTNTIIDIVQKFNIYKLINLKTLNIFIGDPIVLDIMALIHLPKLTNLLVGKGCKLTNEHYLEYLSKKVNIRI